MDYIVYLKYFIAILNGCDTIFVPNKDLLTLFFQDGLKSSIYILLDRKIWDLDNWQKLTKKLLLPKSK